MSRCSMVHDDDESRTRVKDVALEVHTSYLLEEVVATEAFVARKHIFAQVGEMTVGAGLTQLRWRIEREVRLLGKSVRMVLRRSLAKQA